MIAYTRTWHRFFLTISALLLLYDSTSCDSQAPPKQSLHQLLAMAQKGDADSQYQLGMLYEQGSPEATKDSTKAVEWFRRLAEKGDRRGENALGIAYRHGYGVAEDDAVGFEWFYKAALKGYPAAQANLAGAYDGGHGTPRNGSAAFSWRVEAAKNGEFSAQIALCNAYQNGSLVEADPTMAYAWCLAAQAGNHKSSERLIDYLDKAQSLLSPSQAKEAMELASSWSLNHKSGGTMPLHSRSFLASASTKTQILGAQMSTILKPPTAGIHYTRSNGCEAGHWVDSVLSDGEILKLEDGSIWQVDDTDTVDSGLWLDTEDVTVCDGKLINTDDKSSVGVHRLK
jgi:Sel1 repeat